ncbi:MAG: 3TM-type holin [Bryobacterales bacterium]|nr:3TM-type holin [Bryobacterales bacterium]
MFPIGDIIKGAGDIIGKFKISPAEKLDAQHKLNELQVQANQMALDYEENVLKERASIIKAEAQGSWLAANWRPIVMLDLAALMSAHWLGFTPENITQEAVDHMFDVIKLGLGGYIASLGAGNVIREWRKGQAAPVQPPTPQQAGRN